MNKKVTVKNSALPSQENLPIFTALLNLLAQLQAETSLASELSKAFELETLELGEELKVAFGNSEEASSHVLYLVCQGRVRLLGLDSQRQRNVSVLVLEAGDLFGADEQFCWWEGGWPTLTYRAIAASDAQIARITHTQLQSWLERLPKLQEYLREQAHKRQRQLFLKTQTDLRNLPAYQIQQLVPYLVETQVSAGTRLAETTPAEAGRFWLRSGQIDMASREKAKDSETEAKSELPKAEIPELKSMGLSWGYPNSTPKKWVAQTDLRVYKLPKEYWEDAITIAPILDESATEETGAGRARNGYHKVSQARPAKSATARVPLLLNGKVPASNTETQADTQKGKKANGEPAVVFPKPMGRRVLDLLARYPFVRQQSSSDCGAACLATIGQYWGKRFSINYIRELAGVGRSGASLKGLAKAAENLGFKARPVRASLSKMSEQDNPWVAHWQGIHYVVIYKIERNRVLVSDPADGKRWFSRQEMLDHWTGYALLLEPTENLKTAQNEKRSLGKFAAALWPYRGLGLQIIVVSIIMQVFALINPLFTQIILDQVVIQKSQNALTIFCLGALLFGIGNMAMSGVRKYLLAYLSNSLSLTLVAGFISHTLSLPLRFFESRRVGDIITRVSENQKIQRFLIGQVMLSWLNFVTGLIYLGLMLYYNTRLTMLVLGLIPPMVIFTLLATPLLRKLSRERFTASADQNSSLVEMMTGVFTLKSAGAERELRWRWEDRFTTLLNVGFKGKKLGITLEIISGLINSIGGIALLWFGASLVIKGELTIGQFVAFNMMKGRVLSPVMALINLWDELQEVLISVERLNDVFGTEPEELPGSQMLVLPSLRGDIALENMTFRYSEEEERNTLQNISFEVKAGQTVALVGRSGSGKSTLIKLLQGLYHPTSGRITVDGHDLRHVSPHSLRSQLGVVPQDCYLFSGTIADNITLYNEEMPLEEIIEAAKLAEAHAFIQDMPLGYSTKVGERGASLSGGQQQRIAIARALIGEPRILVLDEATSSLDTESERRFQQNLERIGRDRTTFIIAHRLSTVRNADCILVLDRGLLVERGTHSELMELEGLYYHLAQQQLDL